MQGNNSSYAFSRSRMDSRSPPSPAASSPSLTQSASNSSSSPPQPSTPPRQPRPRYPDLGRVPLHRRGTSKTYECLEDLLREAGYKETRIFTPESDKPGNGGRDGHEGEDEDQSSGAWKKQGVGAAVVGFLTGLVTGGNSTMTWTEASSSRQQDLAPHSDDNNPDRRPQSSPAQSPVSPLANKQQRRDRDRDDRGSRTNSEPQTPLMTSSIESLNDPTPRAYRRQNSYSYYIAAHHSRPPSRPTTPSAFHHHHHHQYHALPTSSQQPPQYRHQSSVAQHQLQYQALPSIHNTAATVPVKQGTIPSGGEINDGVDNVIQQPCPSRAGTYLRHMVSVPSIPSGHPPRPNSTPVCQHVNRNSRIDNSSSDIEGVGVTTAKPSLPRNWLENVARAILFGVASTGTTTTTSSSNVPPPSHITSENRTYHHQRTLRATRSSLSQTTTARSNKISARRSGLSDQTNTVSVPPPLESLALPALSTRLERGRAPCSQSVLKAQVVCRSAPASRASSVARGSAAGRDRGGASKRQSLGKLYKGRGDSKAGSGDNTRGRQHSAATHQKIQDKQGKSKPKEKQNKKSRKTDAGKPRVPSLARTRIEGDGWHSLRSRATAGTNLSSDTEHATRFLASPSPDRHRHPNSKSGFSSGYTSAANSYSLDSSTSESYLSSSHSSFDSSTDDHSSDEDEDEEEEEGELTLARMLVPPKRQHSIRSLRKHLHLHSTTSPSPLHSTSSSGITTITTNDKLHPSLSRRLLHNSSTATLRSSTTTAGDAGSISDSGVTGRVVSLSAAQSRLLSLTGVSSNEKDSTPPSRSTATATRRAGGGGTGPGPGEWEHEWRKGKYSSRKSSEDDNEVESLTWLSRDDNNSVINTPNTATATASQRSVKGKSRLGLPSWASSATTTTTASPAQ